MPKPKFSKSFLVRVMFALTVLLLFLMSYLLLSRMDRQVKLSELANRMNQIKLYLEHLQSRIQSIEAGQRGFLLTRDSAFLRSFRQSQNEVNTDIALLDSLVEDPIAQKQMDTLHRVLDKRILLIDSVLDVFSSNAAAAEKQELLVPGKVLMDSIKYQTNRLLHREMQLLNRAQQLKERYTFITPRSALLLIFFVFFVLTLAFAILIGQLRISHAYLQQKEKALEDLKEMDLIYRNAEEVASLGSWQWNLETNMIKCSDNLFRIYGSEPREEQISFERFLSFVVPEDRDRLTNYISKAIGSNEELAITYKIVRADKEVRHMRGVGKLRMDRNGKIVLGATQDITEFVEIVEKLTSSESFNRSITELVPDIIYVYDLDAQTMVYLNKDIHNVIGYSYEELITPGFNFQSIIHPDNIKEAAARQEKFRKLKTGEVFGFEYTLRHKSGEWKSFYARTSCYKRNTNGEVTQVIGAAADITEVRKANERLEQLNIELALKNRELQQSNAELSSFNFIASHDLQEPLRKIQTFISFLEASETNLSELGKFYLQRMQKAATRIRALIQDLLSYSHSTHSESPWGDVDLDSVLENACQSLNAVIEEKKAKVEAHKLPVVQGNELQLQKLFEHILANALKYSKPGIEPVISITTSIITNPHGLTTTLDAERTFQKISIADNGIGFEQEYAGKIFDLFQRLHSRGEEVGSGIGLAICKKIVQYHGGMIEARSVPGQGSVFDIYLPA